MRLLFLLLFAFPAWADFHDPLSTGIGPEWRARGAEHRTDEGGYVRLYFNKNGVGGSPGLTLPFPSQQKEVTVSFDYRMSPGEQGGSKLLKLFDVNNGSTAYSNVTFPQVYESGSWKGAEFGDNVSGRNDSSNFIRLDGSANTPASVKVSSFRPDRKTQESWQSVKIHWRQSDDGRANGEVNIWINGTLRLSADGFRNRGDGHSHLGKLTIGDYTHRLDKGGKSFHMDVRNVSVSFGAPTEPKGAPMPPKIL